MILKTVTGSEFIIDDDMFEIVSRFKWYDNVSYSGSVYAITRGGPYQMYLHHLIAGYPINGLETDHRDRNSMNNTRDNLRSVTRAFNQYNSKDRDREFPRGVYRRKCGKRYRAVITVNKIREYLGTFRSAEEASLAYLKRKSEVYSN